MVGIEAIAIAIAIGMEASHSKHFSVAHYCCCYYYYCYYGYYCSCCYYY